MATLRPNGIRLSLRQLALAGLRPQTGHHGASLALIHFDQKIEESSGQDRSLALYVDLRPVSYAFEHEHGGQFPARLEEGKVLPMDLDARGPNELGR